MRIAFMGTPEIAEDVLTSLCEAGLYPSVVVTQPDREKNRGKKIMPPPVKKRAITENIPVLQPQKIKGNGEFLDELKGYNPEVIVVAAYGRILPRELLDLPKLGCINVHASLLPKFRGASPIQAAILSGELKTGITIMKMEEGLDTGDMIAKAEVEIKNMNYPELSSVLGKLGGKLMVEVLQKLETSTIEQTPQKDEDATYSGLIKKEDGIIDFGSMSAEYIERMVRAYEPWPGVTCRYMDSSMKLKKVSYIQNGETDIDIEDNLNDKICGQIIKIDGRGIYVKAKDDILIIEELQLPGKNKVNASDFLRGHDLKIGERLG